MKLLVACLSFLLSLTQAEIGKTCTDRSHCDQDECCLLPSQFLIVSRRDIAPTSYEEQGTCQKYLQVDQQCSRYGFDRSCGCGHGLRCHTYQVPLPTPSTFPPKTRTSTPPAPTRSAASTSTPVWPTPHNMQFRTIYIPPAMDGYKWVSKCEALLHSTSP
ncbi:hypothetical protein RRG08_040116 [Elysia crispata]|uniref:Uncharacterized protein n=1 Tax=Elysia crispata TaxID=231223 RepID=A0AAE0XW28_9GAST|nr:hypothetical protein RRG08_040116 [Elysia crispata]